MSFTPNRKFWRQYRKLRKEDPATANLFLFLCESADSSGRVEMADNIMMEALDRRFPDPTINEENGGRYE